MPALPSAERRSVSGGSGGGGGGGFQHRPASLLCRGCGGQYFAASLPIHEKTCFQRNAFVELACPTCRCVVTTGRFHGHVAACVGAVAAADRETKSRFVAKPEAAPHELNAAEADGRVRCRQCDRAFHAERIAKHQSVCAGTRLHTHKSRRQTVAVCKETPVIVAAANGRKPSAAAVPSPLTSKLGAAAGHGGRPLRLEFSGGVSSPGSASRQPSSSSWGRDREDKRYDAVHRDASRRHDPGGWGGGRGGSKLNVSTSTATSAANPLATSRLMTVHSW